MVRKVKMRVGMLWFEKNDDILVTIANAAAYYFAKFGQPPSHCHVHPDAFGDKEVIKGGNMKITLDPTIQPNHVWIGVIS